MLTRSSPVRTLAVLVLAGAILLAGGAVLHPLLPAAAGAQLRVMAATRGWRAIHLAMLAGTGLVIVGIWLRLAVGRPGGRGLLVTGLACAVAGLALNAVDIAFMAGGGAADAARYAAGDATVVGAFAGRHMGLMTVARLGNVVVALGCLCLGWADWRDASRPRLLALLAWLAALGGAVGVAAFAPWTPGAVAAVALFSTWAAATALLALSR